MTPTKDRTLAAAGLIAVYAAIIGYTDNYVRMIAEDAGLWQFHLTRALMALVLLGAAAAVFGLRLRPKSWRAVAAKSLLQGTAMLIYFGALAYLPVALVAAGLFTSPIFVLLITRYAYGRPLGPVRVAAVAIGFLGVLLVLGPEAAGGATWAAVLPVVAGALYAMGNIATREWCADETAETMLAGFFVVLGIMGAIGFTVLTLWPLTVPEGPAAFLLRGPVEPTSRFLFWTFVQAVGSLLAIGMMIRAYQITDASRVAVFEYVVLPASAVWGWLLWDERLGVLAWGGMALIMAAGAMIALRAQAQEG